MTATGVAILVDGENISHQHAARILATAAGIGAIRAARVYGHVPQINGWAAAPGFVAVHTARAKDGADLVLAIEAVALSHTPGVGHLVIATSDGGLAPLLHHLRAAGHAVTLTGESKTPAALRLAASRFVALDSPTPSSPAKKLAKPAAELPPSPLPVSTLPATSHRTIDQAIRDAILADPERKGSMSLGELGHRLRQSGHFVSDLGAAKWSTYLQGRADICRLEGVGPAMRVHLIQ